MDASGDMRAEGDDELGRLVSPRRVALVAHWAPDRRVGRSACGLVGALVGHGYTTALVSAAPGPEPLEWATGRPPNVTVLRRPNIGYDFGSWAAALHRYPAITAGSHVLLWNDSLAGPFGPIDHLLRLFDVSAADVWGLTDTSQFTHHLQSYCLGFRNGSLGEAPIARFWRALPVECSRDEAIWRYEIGLGRLLHRERYVVEAAISHDRVVEEGQNPTIIGWRRLLDEGFPFVKRQLLRQPDLAPDGGLVRGELLRRFAIDLDDWA